MDAGKRSRLQRFANRTLAFEGLAADGWVFEWSTKRSVFGECRWSRKVISLSSFMADTQPYDACEETILHEVAHALTPEGEPPHGEVWQALARKLGVCNPRASSVAHPKTKAKLVASARWFMVFGDELIRSYQRRPQAVTFRRVKYGELEGRPETKGRLRLIPASEYHSKS